MSWNVDIQSRVRGWREKVVGSSRAECFATGSIRVRLDKHLFPIWVERPQTVIFPFLSRLLEILGRGNRDLRKTHVLFGCIDKQFTTGSVARWQIRIQSSRWVERHRRDFRSDMNIFFWPDTECERPFTREGIADIDVFIGNHDPLEMIEAKFRPHGHRQLQRKAAMGLLGANPERCSGPAGFRQVNIDDPRYLQFLSEMVPNRSLTYDLPADAAFARRHLAQHPLENGFIPECD